MLIGIQIQITACRI